MTTNEKIGFGIVGAIVVASVLISRCCTKHFADKIGETYRKARHSDD